MSENGNFFTINWKIINFFFRDNILNINSPYVGALAMGETTWRLDLWAQSGNFENSVACYLVRAKNDRGPDQFELDYELSFLARDGSVLHSEIMLQKLFKKGDYYRSLWVVEKDGGYFSKKEVFIPQNTLTIRCIMWDSQNSISQPGRCFAETRFETECQTFNAVIIKFSNTKTSCKNFVCIKSPSTNTYVSSILLCVARDGKLVIEIKPVEDKTTYVYKCKIFVRDVFGNKIKIGQSEFHDSTLQSITLTLVKEHLMENKNYYLPNDVLTLECDVIFLTGKITETIDEPEYGFDGEETVSTVTKTDLNFDENDIETIASLKYDWISVFKEGILCDTTLKTATETFPAHRIVLSARSSVFKSLFTSENEENVKKCIEIDLNADTVRQMLLFMYSAVFEVLHHDSAKNLYFAAMQYNIISLKQRCSNFMKQNLMHSNCCDTLLLADENQDTKLKSAVQEYIMRNDEKVIFSDEWKHLEKSRPRLITEIFRMIYLKNRGH